MQVIGFRDGFRGLMENRTVRLDSNTLSGILTLGRTILGTSRDKSHWMPVWGELLDMTSVMADNYARHHLDALVCLGGGGTQKNAYRLQQMGLNGIMLPKTIDNDVAETDETFGFDTALGIATKAIDRLHSTAHSHHRIIVVEVMEHRVGWLALGAGIAGGANVILISEIPYDVEFVAEARRRRSRSGKRFSIVAVAEGARTVEEHAEIQTARDAVDETENKEERREANAEVVRLEEAQAGSTLRLAKRLEELTGLESRLAILGNLQRGGAPSAADRLLATQLGTACVTLINGDVYGVMVAARGSDAVPVPLDQVTGKLKDVPLDHPWIESARLVGTCLGDRE